MLTIYELRYNYLNSRRTILTCCVLSNSFTAAGEEALGVLVVHLPSLVGFNRCFLPLSASGCLGGGEDRGCEVR